ncbi:GNAT family N-acetyltransferase [Methanocalculus taiwanensis]|uniref:GNAT family N-acetyltransferase n=1 Tax=Methanocalculus taiwanensis TaxID=106207 RepID=A0ABD4TH00_9EURY|nr:GNAT family N-acetyltransferase [Methanocalculus taiwanensis]MCQ1538242.1 GNAT family N-acetyltransferase [Methanocalculus taiwanensis]
MVIIRIFENGDCEAVARMEERSSGSISGAYVFIRQMQAISGDTFFVAVADDCIAGYTIGSIVGRSPDTGWILRLQVADRYKRNGIGRRLMEQLLATFEAMGVTKALLSVSPENHAALPLYRSLGFTEHSFESEYFGPGGDRYIMAIKL